MSMCLVMCLVMRYAIGLGLGDFLLVCLFLPGGEGKIGLLLGWAGHLMRERSKVSYARCTVTVALDYAFCLSERTILGFTKHILICFSH